MELEMMKAGRTLLKGPEDQVGIKADPRTEPMNFADTLKNEFKKVNRLQSEANEAVTEMTVGGTKNIHQTMIALEKANLSFRLMMQVRNKVVDAYREVIRMQV
jgi:flagellar hook-basal body complex protein FliE